MRTGPVRRVAVMLAFAGALPGEALPGQTGALPEVVSGRDFRVYDADGRASSLEEIVERALVSDVLLIGEEHDDAIGHALELELLERVTDGAERPVVLSLEMFERDVQPVLDEYLAGLITEEHFLASARPWDQYRSRYRPLVEAAKARGLDVFASNAPRRYVNRVTREGPASLLALSDWARRHLPPLPYPGPSERYRAEWDSVMGEARRATGRAEEARPAREARPEAAAPQGPDASPEDPPHYATSPNALQAQALWDAAMGHAISAALMEHLGAVVVHVAGSFHVARGTGIPERIADYRPGTRVLTVVMATENDLASWDESEHAGLADFVILTAEGGEGR